MKNGISRARMLELKYFCRQYYEKKRKLKELCIISASRTDEKTKAADVAETAIAEIKLKKDIEVMEEACREGAGNLGKWILKSLAEGGTYERSGAPCGRRQFYEAKKRVLILIDKKG